MRKDWSVVTKAAVSPLRSLFGDAGGSVSTNPWGGWLREPFSGAWQRSVQIDPIGDLTAYGAVYACLTLIANDIGKLKPMLLDKGTVSTPSPDNAPHWRTLKRPNAYQTRHQFFRQWMLSKLMFGNAYILKEREDLRGIVRAMYVLDPRRVMPHVTDGGDIFYSVNSDNLTQHAHQGVNVLPASEIIHDRCCTLWHPLVGVPPLYAAARSATQGRRIQDNSSQFFENMSRPSGMLTAPGKIDDATASRLKRDWEQNYSGHNIGRLAVLGDNLKYEPMTIPAEQAQLIEQLKWTATDICGPFHVPPYKIGVGQIPTNNNVEALNLQYYSECIQTHLEDIEELLEYGLEIPQNKIIQFDLDGLLRMDSAAQMEMIARGVEKAIFTPNEGRAMKNMPPKTGGDELYLQQQNFSLPALKRRDESEDPFGSAKASESSAPPAPPPPPDDIDSSTEPDDDESPEEQAKRVAEIVLASLSPTIKMIDGIEAKVAMNDAEALLNGVAAWLDVAEPVT